jgi:hypothetical protein
VSTARNSAVNRGCAASSDIGPASYAPPRTACTLTFRRGYCCPVLVGGRVYGGIALALVSVVGCGGGGDYANKPRPPAPINVTAAITNSRVNVSPQRFGAGPIVLIISNQSSTAQRVTFETNELGGSQPGRKFNTTPINPRATATLKVEVRQGVWKLSASRGGVRPAAVAVGRKRKSAQNELLQP